MTELIDFESYPLKETVELLLADKTTKKHIIWATKSYEEKGIEFGSESQMMLQHINRIAPIILTPRKNKALSQQQVRTRKHAEVFTPSWICNKMNNYCDEEWFGRKEVFNSERGRSWETKQGKVDFPKGKSWKKYIDTRHLEITCGEAPFLVSRYDTATGEEIAIGERIGILDRKLRVVNENTETEAEWLYWTIRAYQSTYGYEYQGDNLLIGRINLLLTFTENIEHRWKRQATKNELKKIANIIAWNIWQMDGRTDCTPYGIPSDNYVQMSLFGEEAADRTAEETGSDEMEQLSLFGRETTESDTETPRQIQCKIYDWRSERSIVFATLKERRKK